MTVELLAVLNELADARSQQADAKAALDAIIKAPEVVALQDKAAEIGKRVTKLETQARTLGVQIYEAMPEDQKVKKINDWVGIREETELNYDKPAAKAWAEQHQPDFIVLDERRFEAYAKDVEKSAPLGFVEYKKVASATIAKDLSGVIAEVGK